MREGAGPPDDEEAENIKESDVIFRNCAEGKESFFVKEIFGTLSVESFCCLMDIV